MQSLRVVTVGHDRCNLNGRVSHLKTVLASASDSAGLRCSSRFCPWNVSDNANVAGVNFPLSSRALRRGLYFQSDCEEGNFLVSRTAHCE